MRRVLLALVVALSGCLAMMTPAVHAQTPTYYLALGDSLSYGYQPNLDLHHGYTQNIYNNLLQTQPGLQFENLSCVDETTSTMLGLNGTHCPYWQYSTGMTTTPQITQTLSFIQAHPGQISLVTLDIGANDLLQAIQGGITLPKILQLLTELHTNLDSIYGQLRAAVGNTVPIGTMTYYNPLIVISSSPLITVGVKLFNNVISSEAAKFGVGVAPIYNAFNSGSVAQQQHTICAWTWFCSSTHKGDIHCNTQGYAVIAYVFEKSGIGKAVRRYDSGGRAARRAG